jgi:Uma2 family endonuclease
MAIRHLAELVAWLGGVPLHRIRLHPPPGTATEILSPENTAEEMAIKQKHFFTAGTTQIWVIDPDTRVISIYSSPTQFVTLTVGDTLDGEPLLAGFRLPLAEFFSELDRQG